MISTRIDPSSLPIALVAACGQATATDAPDGTTAPTGAIETAEPGASATRAGHDAAGHRGPGRSRCPAAARSASRPARCGGIGQAELETDAPAGVLRSVIAEAASRTCSPPTAGTAWSRDPDTVVFVALGPGDPPWVMVEATRGADGWTARWLRGLRRPARPAGRDLDWPTSGWTRPHRRPLPTARPCTALIMRAGLCQRRAADQSRPAPDRRLRGGSRHGHGHDQRDRGWRRLSQQPVRAHHDRALATAGRAHHPRRLCLPAARHERAACLTRRARLRPMPDITDKPWDEFAGVRQGKRPADRAHRHRRAHRPAPRRHVRSRHRQDPAGPRGLRGHGPGAELRRAQEADGHARALLGNALRFFIIVIAGLMVMGRLGLDIGPAVAGLGVVGIAVGLRRAEHGPRLPQRRLILIENQFAKGDVVRIAGVAGTVEDFTLRRTTLRDLDGVVHTVPNGEIKVASNLTRVWSRINQDVTVAYGTDIDKAIGGRRRGRPRDGRRARAGSAGSSRRRGSSGSRRWASSGSRSRSSGTRPGRRPVGSGRRAAQAPARRLRGQRHRDPAAPARRHLAPAGPDPTRPTCRAPVPPTRSSPRTSDAHRARLDRADRDGWLE